MKGERKTKPAAKAKRPGARRRKAPPRAASAANRGQVIIAGILCRAHGWPAPVAEYRFAPPRRWRFDLAWPAIYLAVEVQGGLFSGGRHVRGPALLDEMEKLNAAQVAGWTVLQVTPQQVTDGVLADWLSRYFARWFPTTVPAGQHELRLMLATEEA